MQRALHRALPGRQPAHVQHRLSPVHPVHQGARAADGDPLRVARDAHGIEALRRFARLRHVDREAGNLVFLHHHLHGGRAHPRHLAVGAGAGGQDVQLLLARALLQAVEIHADVVVAGLGGGVLHLGHFHRQVHIAQQGIQVAYDDIAVDPQDILVVDRDMHILEALLAGEVGVLGDQPGPQHQRQHQGEELQRPVAQRHVFQPRQRLHQVGGLPVHFPGRFLGHIVHASPSFRPVRWGSQLSSCLGVRALVLIYSSSSSARRALTSRWRVSLPPRA